MCKGPFPARGATAKVHSCPSLGASLTWAPKFSVQYIRINQRYHGPAALFADAKTGKNSPEQCIARDAPGYLPERVLDTA